MGEFAVDSSADDELLQATDVDWEQLLAATFDPADAMLLGPDEPMFSLNRNDLLYAQKYAAARTGAAPPTAADHALNDADLERCANDLDRFVNDLELACANIDHRSGADITLEQSLSNTNGRDLDHDQGHLNNLDLDKIQRKSSHSDAAADDHDMDNDSTQGQTTVLEFYEGRDKLQPTNDVDDDIGGCEGDFENNIEIENCLQNSDEVVCPPEDCSSEEVSRQRRVLSDLDPDDPNDLEVNNGPAIALQNMTDDLAPVHRYPYDPDPEATVV